MSRRAYEFTGTPSGTFDDFCNMGAIITSSLGQYKVIQNVLFFTSFTWLIKRQASKSTARLKCNSSALPYALDFGVLKIWHNNKDIGR